MVKVRGPMLSVDASGTLSDTVSFSHWKGRSYVRKHAVPANPQSGAQSGRRAMFAFLTAEWASHYQSWKDSWNDQAKALQVSAYHAYVAFNLEHWHNFLAPMAYRTGARTLTIGVITDPFTADWDEHRIKLVISMTTKNNNWGFIIFASPTPPCDPDVPSTILVVPMKSVATYTIFWTPPTVDTWYFKGMPFAADGNLGAAIDGGDATP